MTVKNFNRALFAFAVLAFGIHLCKKNQMDKKIDPVKIESSIPSEN